MSFSFESYSFNRETGEAFFRYKSEEVNFEEKVAFYVENGVQCDAKALARALEFAFVVLGTSYYKARAGREVNYNGAIDEKQVRFYDDIYQNGLSQFAFENHLTRDDLAHFALQDGAEPTSRDDSDDADVAPERSLVMVSGGKDSLLVAEMMRESGKYFRVAYITAQENYPQIIDLVSDNEPPIIIRRFIDKEGLKQVGGMNGHVPVTMINEALALIQAILINANHVEFGIGREGIEAHTWIGDLPVNHQWSKTPEAQEMLKEYVRDYISPKLTIGSLLEEYSELEIAELFAKKCWAKYGDKFSSCNVANYKQGADNRELKWCGKCAKCANSYLLFAPYVSHDEQLKLFGYDLFIDPDLTEIYKGLLGVDGVMKPFECVASIDELREAYRKKLPGYGDLPFEIPE